MPGESQTVSGEALLGFWSPSTSAQTPANVQAMIGKINQPLVITSSQNGLNLSATNQGSHSTDGEAIIGLVPAIMPEQLGDPSFRADHGLRYAYLSGAMANGIGSVEIAVAMAKAGMMGFFGAAGLAPQSIEDAVVRLQREAPNHPWGVNLIHAPQEPSWEEKVTDILIKHGVHLIEASAYLRLTPAVVRYRTHGIYQDANGQIITPNRIVAKVSRIEVATRFFSPPPKAMLDQLVKDGHLTPEQAQLASKIPVAQDLTAEADSGGHTDNRPAITMMPTMIALRDRMQEQFKYQQPLRIGIAGGISTPAAAMAAFAMGAAYVVVGSVNQACIESGTSDVVRDMLAKAEQADIAMAPAADMFEMGVELQVLKRGTMFPMKAAKLYELYRAYPSLEALPADERKRLEEKYFQTTLEDIWEQTRAFFTTRDPSQITRANADPHHKMALVFRWYLGKSSGWANSGNPARRVDYQVWCGPAMGAFNEWAKGTYLEAPANRRVAEVAQNILYGAAYMTRLNALRAQGYPVTPSLERVAIQQPQDLKEFFGE